MTQDIKQKKKNTLSRTLHVIHVNDEQVGQLNKLLNRSIRKLVLQKEKQKAVDGNTMMPFLQKQTTHHQLGHEKLQLFQQLIHMSQDLDGLGHS